MRTDLKALERYVIEANNEYGYNGKLEYDRQFRQVFSLSSSVRNTKCETFCISYHAFISTYVNKRSSVNIIKFVMIQI